MFELFPGEQLDDLQDKGYKIIQHPKGYCFTSDAVLLAKFACVKTSEILCDLCSGSGIVPTLIFLKHPFSKALLVEIDEEACSRAKRSVVGNKISNFEVLNLDLKDCLKFIEQKSIDVITVNPPYMETSIGEIEENEKLAIARREIKVELEDIVAQSSKLLKFGGRFYMINSTNRLTDSLFLMRKYQIEPKVIQFVFPKQGRESNVVLIEGKMNGKKGVKVLPPYFVR